MNRLVFFRLVALLSRHLSRRAAYAVARPVSGLTYRHWHAMRQALAANLRVVLDAGGRAWTETELEALVRATFENFGKYLVDFFRMGRFSPAALAEVVTVEHDEYLGQCRAPGRGIIGLTAHLGNWELGAVVLAGYGCRVNAVVLRQPTPALDALFQSRRTDRGIRVLPADGAARAALKALGQEEFVALLADLDFFGRESRVPFFGRPARLPRGPAVLAARSGAPILPAFVLRLPDDRYCLRMYPPIFPDQCGSVDAIQRRICAVLEEVIAAHPDQWFAFAPLWPDAEPDRGSGNRPL